jgi:FKBP-type peptidyl-prolyl cis-trans isomerase FklB
MKKNTLIGAAVIGALLLVAACNPGTATTELKSKNDSVAYVIGTSYGSNLIENITRDSIDLPLEALIQGFRDAFNQVDSLVFTETQKQAIMMEFQRDLQMKQMEKIAKEAKVHKEAGLQWLQENKAKEGVAETPSGLQYKIVKMGNGLQPKLEDNVTVNYEGKLLDGKIFDSSFDRGEPAEFVLGQVIRGWQEGLMLMKEGSSFELYIPSDLAYGDQGNQGIPGGSTLIFKVDLIKVKPAGSK